MSLLVEAKKDEQGQDEDSKSPEIHLMEVMAMALHPYLSDSPELARSLTDFFRRLARILQPDYSWQIDLAFQQAP